MTDEGYPSILNLLRRLAGRPDLDRAQQKAWNMIAKTDHGRAIILIAARTAIRALLINLTRAITAWIAVGCRSTIRARILPRRILPRV